VVDQRRDEAAEKLGKRADEEAARFCKVLEEQRKRILSSRSRVKENPDQLLLELGDIADAEELKAVRRQVADNWRYWEQRLRSIDTDLEREPDRIRRTFALQTHRVEPAGAIYLWPQEVAGCSGFAIVGKVLRIPRSSVTSGTSNCCAAATNSQS
jgi:hypothetical protein